MTFSYKKTVSVALLGIALTLPLQAVAQDGSADNGNNHWDVYPNVVEFTGQRANGGPTDNARCGIENGPAGRAVMNDYRQLTTRSGNDAVQIIGYGGKLAAVRVTNFNNGAAVVNVVTEGFSNSGTVITQEGQYDTANDVYNVHSSSQPPFITFEAAAGMYKNIGDQCTHAFTYRAKPADQTLEEMASTPEYMAKRQTTTAGFFGAIAAKLGKLSPQ